MKSYAIIGMTGEGKSPLAKSFIRNTEKPCLVLDVNNEYGEFDKYGNPSFGLSTDVSQPRCRYIGRDIKKFISICEKKRGCNIIIEEATAFLRGQIGKEIVSLVIGKMFTKNNYIFVFHSIRSIPPALLDFMDYVILFKTGDTYDMVKKKDSRFIEPFLDVMRRPYPYKPITIAWLGK